MVDWFSLTSTYRLWVAIQFFKILPSPPDGRCNDCTATLRFQSGPGRGMNKPGDLAQAGGRFHKRMDGRARGDVDRRDAHLGCLTSYPALAITLAAASAFSRRISASRTFFPIPTRRAIA